MSLVWLSLLCVSVSGLKVTRDSEHLVPVAEAPVSFTKIPSGNFAKNYVFSGSNFVEPTSVTHTLDDTAPVPMATWIIDVVCIAGVLLIGYCMNAASEESSTKGLCAVIVYCLLSTLIDINISASGTGVSKDGFQFEPACAVMIIEVLKLFVSLILYTITRFPALAKGESFVQHKFSTKDTCYLAVPGALYCLNNILLYYAAGNNELASYGVFRDTNVIFTAVIWCLVFKSSLGFQRNLAIGGVFVGLCLNQVMPLMDASWTPAIAFVAGMALTNSCAAVSNELAIKQNMDMDLNLQNAVVYSFCSAAACFYVAAKNPAKLTSPSVFFDGMGVTAIVVMGVQVVTGLMVSRILKYANAVTKTVAGALRGPILVFLAPLAGLHSRTDLLTIFSAFIVSFAACYFLMQGRPTPGTASSK